ncbi:MAG: hypothetical protein OSA45_01660 [Halioglobus sp.]|nr:hypothetical protein [Halioglobus sp.]
MSDYLEDLKRLKAEVSLVATGQLENGVQHLPKPELEYVRKNPIRRNLPRWLEGRESFLKGHYRLTLESGQLESDLDTDGFACERLECHYKTALSTVYLAEDGWNHREQNRPGTELELALKELVHVRVEGYLRDYLRHFRYRKPKGELVKAVLASYPHVQKALVEKEISHVVAAAFILERSGISVSENTISYTLGELKAVEK